MPTPTRVFVTTYSAITTAIIPSMPNYKQFRYGFAKKGLQYLWQHKSLLLFPALGKLSYLVCFAWLASPLLNQLLHDSQISLQQAATAYAWSALDIQFFIIFVILLYINNVINTACYGALMLIVYNNAHQITHPW